jgi:hypothetical protein
LTGSCFGHNNDHQSLDGKRLKWYIYFMLLKGLFQNWNQMYINRPTCCSMLKEPYVLHHVSSCFFRKDSLNMFGDFIFMLQLLSPFHCFCLRFFQQVSILNLTISFSYCNILPLWIFRFLVEIKGNVILVEHIHRAESLQHFSTPVVLSLWFVSRENWTWSACISFCAA